MMENIHRLIDHTLLKPMATEAQIATLCAEAAAFQFASVCVNPTHVRLAARLLAGSGVPVCTVIGFPLGANSRSVKQFETRQTIQDGAQEVDMVINIGALKAQHYSLVYDDITAVVQTAHASQALVKVIIETAYLTDEEKVIACQLVQAAKADFVKTSTGFGPGGATLEDVRVMRQTVGAEMGVKAAGGIRSYADAIAMVDAGATRLGASAGVQIAKEAAGEAVDAAGGADY